MVTRKRRHPSLGAWEKNQPVKGSSETTQGGSRMNRVLRLKRSPGWELVKLGRRAWVSLETGWGLGL